jgi:DNA-binding MarR family transcriptional regulator
MGDSGVGVTGRQGPSARIDSDAPSATSAASTGRKDEKPGATPREERTERLDDLGRTFRHLLRAVQRLRGRDTHLLDSEVSHAQFELLIELYERGPMSARDLANAAELTPATVTQMLDHLADRGHVERTRLEVDRRVVVSRLTVGGRRKIEDKRAIWKECWERVLAEANAEELRITTRLLERISLMFDDPPDPGVREEI